jgi:hypothetical protein
MVAVAAGMMAVLILFAALHLWTTTEEMTPVNAAAELPVIETAPISPQPAIGTTVPLPAASTAPTTPARAIRPAAKRAMPRPEAASREEPPLAVLPPPPEPGITAAVIAPPPPIATPNPQPAAGAPAWVSPVLVTPPVAVEKPPPPRKRNWFMRAVGRVSGRKPDN